MPTGAYHKVVQGDYLAKIAEKYGYSDFAPIWNHPANANLKKQRPNPNVLFPGDAIFIPEKQEKTETKSTSRIHKFKTTGGTVTLRIILKDAFAAPIANARCTLAVGGATQNLVTGADGKIEQTIPMTADTAELVVKDEKTPIKDAAIPIKIGHLDPVTEVSGQKARLNNLGYNAGKITAAGGGSGGGAPVDFQFKSAVEEFQCDQGLQVDGACGPKTQAKLLSEHGC